MSSRRRAFLLPVALAILFILMTLGVMLMMQGQVTHSMVLGENERFLDLVTVQEMEAKVGASLDALPYQGKPGDLTSSSGLGKVRWTAGQSVYTPPNLAYATYARLFSTRVATDPNADLPRASYATSGQPTTPFPLASEHSFVQIDLGDFREQVVYSDLFPYAAYAPGGGVELTQAVSYRNPTYSASPAAEATDHSPGSRTTYPSSGEATARPVHVLAGGALQVADFPYGSARSEQGPTNVTGGAFARTGPYGQSHDYALMLEDQLTQALGVPGVNEGQQAGVYSQLATNKTHLIRGATLSIGTVVKLVMGTISKDDIGAETLLSVEQAMTFPLPVIPKVITRALFYKLLLYHPYPSDLAVAEGRSMDKSAEVEPLIRDRTALENQITALKPTLTKAKTDLDVAKAEPSPSPDKVEELQKSYDDLQSQMNELEEKRQKVDKDIQETLSENQRLKDELENGNVGRVFPPPPSTPAEEANAVTIGWTYFRLIGVLINLIVELIDKLISGENILDTIMSALFVSTRLVHFSGGDPEFWPAGTREWRYDLVMRPRPLKLSTEERINYNCWKGTWNIPPGRTLKLKGNWLFEGDLWLQRGSALVIEGGLIVDYPGTFNDFAGKPVGGDEFLTKPTGRIVLEPGSTLAVKGKLEVAGGDEHNGSITLVNPYGDPSMLTTSVLCSGDVVLKYGVHSGVTLADLFARLGDEVPNVKNFASNYNSFFSGESARAATCAPFTGPWGSRTCWFAEYASTFFIFPILGPAAGPWPIPVPDGNCLRPAFLALTWIYTLELNWNLGEYGLTMSFIWPFPRGVVPTLLKVDPNLVKDTLTDLPADQLVPDSTDKSDILSTEIPRLVQWLVTFAVQDVLRGLVDQTQDGCGMGRESSVGKTVGDAEKNFKSIFKVLFVAKTLLAQTYAKAMRPIKRMNALISAKMLGAFGSPAASSLPVRENGGLLLYAGNNLTIGNLTPAVGDSTRARMACGMFVARQNLTINADITVGTLISLYGSIRAQKLYHFPYFSRASLYVPRTLDYGQEITTTGTPEGTATPLVVGRPIYWATARGWEQQR